MPNLQRDGATITWEVHGEGPPILLGHSLLADGRMWEDVVEGLKDDYTLIVPDARGHRNSSAPKAFSLEDLAADWLAILDQEGVERAIFAGLSMGGMTAMRLAHVAPERVAGLMFLDTRAGREPALNRMKYRLMARIYRRFGLVGAIESQVMKLMFGRDALRHRPELISLHRERILEHDRSQLFRAIYAVANRGDFTSKLAAIAVPVMVLVGDQDVATPPSCARKLHAHLPNASLAIVPGCGHLSAVEKPAEVLAHVRTYLTTLLTESA